VGQLVVDVGGGQHRLGALDAGLVLDPAEDAPLASVQPAVDTGVHSKTSWGRTGEGREAPRLFEKTRGVSSLSAPMGLGLRLVGDYSGSRLNCTQAGMLKPAEDVLRGDLS